MSESGCDYHKLAELTEEKQHLDEILEAKMERFIELQDLVDSFN